MNNQEQQYETIREKLRKLLALAERGAAGEADNARRLFETLCRKHGLKPEDFEEEERIEAHIFKVGQNKMLRDIFMACALRLGLEGRGYKTHREKWVVATTKVEAAELREMFEWHKANFERELEKMQSDLVLAYRYKHRLVSQKKDEDREEAQLTPEEIEKIRRMLRMADDLSDNTYMKMLENKNK